MRDELRDELCDELRDELRDELFWFDFQGNSFVNVVWQSRDGRVTVAWQSRLKIWF